MSTHIPQPTATQYGFDPRELPGATRIGLVWLNVPPINIHYTNTKFEKQMTTLRQRSDNYIKSGRGMWQFDMDLVFSGTNMINGKLAYLIGQIRRTPFTMLYNNTVLKMISYEADTTGPDTEIPIAITGYSMNTETNLPDTIIMRLSFIIFNYSPFLSGMRFLRQNISSDRKTYSIDPTPFGIEDSNLYRQYVQGNPVSPYVIDYKDRPDFMFNGELEPLNAAFNTNYEPNGTGDDLVSRIERNKVLRNGDRIVKVNPNYISSMDSTTGTNKSQSVTIGYHVFDIVSALDLRLGGYLSRSKGWVFREEDRRADVLATLKDIIKPSDISKSTDAIIQAYSGNPYLKAMAVVNNASFYYGIYAPAALNKYVKKFTITTTDKTVLQGITIRHSIPLAVMPIISSPVPTCQYMGGAASTITLTIESHDENFVETILAVDKTIEASARHVRRHSGAELTYLENDIANLNGTFIVDTSDLDIQNVEGEPGSYIITYVIREQCEVMNTITTPANEHRDLKKRLIAYMITSGNGMGWNYGSTYDFNNDLAMNLNTAPVGRPNGLVNDVLQILTGTPTASTTALATGFLSPLSSIVTYGEQNLSNLFGTGYQSYLYGSGVSSNSQDQTSASSYSLIPNVSYLYLFLIPSWIRTVRNAFIHFAKSVAGDTGAWGWQQTGDDILDAALSLPGNVLDMTFNNPTTSPGAVEDIAVGAAQVYSTALWVGGAAIADVLLAGKNAITEKTVAWNTIAGLLTSNDPRMNLDRMVLENPSATEDPSDNIDTQKQIGEAYGKIWSVINGTWKGDSLRNDPLYYQFFQFLVSKANKDNISMGSNYNQAMALDGAINIMADSDNKRFEALLRSPKLLEYELKILSGNPMKTTGPDAYAAAQRDNLSFTEEEMKNDKTKTLEAVNLFFNASLDGTQPYPDMGLPFVYQLVDDTDTVLPSGLTTMDSFTKKPLINTFTGQPANTQYVKFTQPSFYTEEYSAVRASNSNSQEFYFYDIKDNINNTNKGMESIFAHGLTKGDIHANANTSNDPTSIAAPSATSSMTASQASNQKDPNSIKRNNLESAVATKYNQQQKSQNDPSAIPSCAGDLAFGSKSPGGFTSVDQMFFNKPIAKAMGNVGVQTSNQTIRETQIEHKTFTSSFTDLNPDIDITMAGIVKDAKEDILNTPNYYSLNKAYPTYKFYFRIPGQPQFLLFDNFYDYRAIESIRYYKDKSSPSAVLHLVMNNYNEILTDYAAALAKMSYNAYDINNDTRVQDPNSGKALRSLWLEAGTEVQLKIGYDANPSNLTTIFNGFITEVQPGEHFEIVCQSYGAELFGDADMGYISGLVMSPQAFLNWMLLSTSKTKHLGHTLFNATILPEGNHDFIDGNIIDNNVYLGVDDEPGKLAHLQSYNADNMSMWDVLQDIAAMHPGYICQTVPYDNRETIFFGRPDHTYKFTQDLGVVAGYPEKLISSLDPNVGPINQIAQNGSSQLIRDSTPSATNPTTVYNTKYLNYLQWLSVNQQLRNVMKTWQNKLDDTLLGTSGSAVSAIQVQNLQEYCGWVSVLQDLATKDGIGNIESDLPFPDIPAGVATPSTDNTSTTNSNPNNVPQSVQGLAPQGSGTSSSSPYTIITSPPNPTLPDVGLRNNNPGSLRTLGQGRLWQGQIGDTGTDFCVFEDIASGLRAMAIITLNYQRLYNITNIHDFSYKYAPPYNDKGVKINDTELYISQLSGTLGIGPNDTYDLYAGNPFPLWKMIKAIAINENSDTRVDKYITDQQFQDAANAAFSALSGLGNSNPVPANGTIKNKLQTPNTTGINPKKTQTPPDANYIGDSGGYAPLSMLDKSVNYALNNIKNSRGGVDLDSSIDAIIKRGTVANPIPLTEFLTKSSAITVAAKYSGTFNDLQTQEDLGNNNTTSAQQFQDAEQNYSMTHNRSAIKDAANNVVGTGNNIETSSITEAALSFYNDHGVYDPIAILCWNKIGKCLAAIIQTSNAISGVAHTTEMSVAGIEKLPSSHSASVINRISNKAITIILPGTTLAVASRNAGTSDSIISSSDTNKVISFTGDIFNTNIGVHKALRQLITSTINNINPAFQELQYFIGKPPIAKRFRKYHIKTSYQHIMNNSITLNYMGMWNSVKVKYKDSSLFNMFIPGVLTSFLSALPSAVNPFGNTEFNIQAGDTLYDRIIRETTITIENAKTRYQARRYATSILAEGIRNMYHGQLTLFGDPDIKPTDVIMIYDAYNQMYGPIEVKSVTHVIDADSGFITIVEPQAYVEPLGMASSTSMLIPTIFAATSIALIAGYMFPGTRSLVKSLFLGPAKKMVTFGSAFFVDGSADAATMGTLINAAEKTAGVTGLAKAGSSTAIDDAWYSVLADQNQAIKDAADKNFVSNFSSGLSKLSSETGQKSSIKIDEVVEQLNIKYNQGGKKLGFNSFSKAQITAVLVDAPADPKVVAQFMASIMTDSLSSAASAIGENNVGLFGKIWGYAAKGTGVPWFLGLSLRTKIALAGLLIPSLWYHTVAGKDDKNYACPLRITSLNFNGTPYQAGLDGCTHQSGWWNHLLGQWYRFQGSVRTVGDYLGETSTNIMDNVGTAFDSLQGVFKQ